MSQNKCEEMFSSVKLSFASQKQIPLLFRYPLLNLEAVRPQIISPYIYFPLLLRKVTVYSATWQQCIKHMYEEYSHAHLHTLHSGRSEGGGGTDDNKDNKSFHSGTALLL